MSSDAAMIMKSLLHCAVLLLVALAAFDISPWLLSPLPYAEAAEATKLVFTKQGPVRGRRIEVRPDLLSGDGLVDAFFGLPYAYPPTGQMRFMPPSSPQSWSPRVREAVELPAVCPQVIPDLSDKAKALRYMTVGRYNYLIKLFQHLKDQSEDCLYLNIYTPTKYNTNSAFASAIQNDGTSAQGLPVIVFIHGESYEWNSGNPYDGSVLAAYGKVVVVTLNYRLGVLGFLRPGIGKDVVSNFGILDQVAALHWLKENVGAFGGNPDSVTLVGHGSGAALVSFLMTSPVANPRGQALFQKAILMSGSSLSPMATARDPSDITMQVFRSLNCTSMGSMASRSVSDVTISRCLREASLQDLLKVKLNVPMYTTPFGPIVDGGIVPDEPLVTLSQKGRNNLFAKYDVMFGLSESEAFHLFPASLVTYGVNSKEQRSIVRTFLRNIYNVNVDQILTAVMNEYTDYRHTGENKMVNRDTLLAIFSDARVAAPVLQSASLHSEAKEPNRAYLYVFKHVTKKGYYPEVFGSLHGEELAYGLGMPLTGGSNHLQQNYTFQEQVLSEVMMHYWANFARTGQPSSNKPERDLGGMMKSLAVAQPKKVLTSPFSQTLEQIAPTWPPFDPQSQKYMALDLESSVNSFYRPHKMALWNHLVPDLVELSVQEREVDKLPHSKYPIDEDTKNEAKNGGHHGGGSGGYHSPHDKSKTTNSAGGGSQKDGSSAKNPTLNRERISEEGIPVLIVVSIGIVLLLLNVCACGAVIYQKHRVRQREDNLRRRIKRLSDAGMISRSGGQDSSNDYEPPRYCGISSNDNGSGTVVGACNDRDAAAEDTEDEDEDHNNVVEVERIEADSSGQGRVYVIADHHLGHHHVPPPPPHPHPPQGNSFLHHGSGLKSALRSQPTLSQQQQHHQPSAIQSQVYDVSFDDDYLHLTTTTQQPLNSQDSSRCSRSMGNNLDSVHINGTSAASRSIAALDVLPRGPLIYNEQVANNSSSSTTVQPQQQPRRTLLPKVMPDLPGVCHSLRSHFASHGSTTASSASGSSRPPSPIIEVIPVSQYESLYGGHRMSSTRALMPPSSAAPNHSEVAVKFQRSNNNGNSAGTGVVYPIYNHSTLPMVSRSNTGFDYGGPRPRGAGPELFDHPAGGGGTLRVGQPTPGGPRPYSQHGPHPPQLHWGTLPHHQPSPASLRLSSGTTMIHPNHPRNSSISISPGSAPHFSTRPQTQGQVGGTLPINLAASGQHYSHQQPPYQPQQQHIDANPSSTNNRVVHHPHPPPPPKSVTYSSQKQVAAGGGGGIIPTVSVGPPTPAASYPPTGSSSMTTASGISMGQPLQSPHASTTSTSTPQSSTTTIAAASSSEGQEDNNTKEKLSLTKTNSDETTEVEKHPRPSQPLRPSCLSPQAKE